MDKHENPYVILHLSPDASQTEIKKAYRTLALKHHPDRQTSEKDTETATAMFAKLSAAYEILTDEDLLQEWKHRQECKKRADDLNASGSRHSKSPTAGPRRSVGTSPTTGGKPHRSKSNPKPRRSSTAADQEDAETVRRRGSSGGRRPTVSPPGSPPPARQREKLSSSSGHGGQPKRSSSAGKRPSANRHAKVSLNSSSAHEKRPERASIKTSSAHEKRPERASMHKTSSHDKRPEKASMSKAPPVSEKRPSQHRPAEPRRSSTQQQQRQQPLRDPFAIFDKLMKEEFGNDYKTSEKSGWILPAVSKATKKESSKKEFQKLDINQDASLSKKELQKYIESHADLWQFLGQRLDLSVKECITIATRVAFQLAKGIGERKPLTNSLKRSSDLGDLTRDEFTHFHKTYVLSDSGAQEFFFRTLFAAFDTNQDGVLQKHELDRFLDLFYDASNDSVFTGSKKLPSNKAALRQRVLQKLDKNRDGVLTYYEIRDLLQVAAVVTQ